MSFAVKRVAKVHFVSQLLQEVVLVKTPSTFLYELLHSLKKVKRLGNILRNTMKIKTKPSQFVSW